MRLGPQRYAAASAAASLVSTTAATAAAAALLVDSKCLCWTDLYAASSIVGYTFRKYARPMLKQAADEFLQLHCPL